MDDKDIAHLRSWIGRSESATEVLSPVPARCLAATLSLPPQLHAQDALPPLWHWLYFLDTTPSDQLGEDGAPRSQSLMPPVPLEQVMWAGAELEFFQPLRCGLEARRESALTDLSFKHGSRGDMVFATWEHRYEQQGQLVLLERSKAVFLGASNGSGNGRDPERRAAVRDKEWLMNEAVLFRYSALTFNAHRIHYDHRYARDVGNYPGLVVHGPLQATLLAETFRAWHPQRRVQAMEFRARTPLYLGTPVTVCTGETAGEEVSLWTRCANGGAAMECRITAN